MLMMRTSFRSLWIAIGAIFIALALLASWSLETAYADELASASATATKMQLSTASQGLCSAEGEPVEVSLDRTFYESYETPAEPSVTITCNETRLYENTDYTIEYENNTAAGTGKVIVTGVGNYSGTAELTFSIVEPNNSWFRIYSAIGSADGTPKLVKSYSKSQFCSLANDGVVSVVSGWVHDPDVFTGTKTVSLTNLLADAEVPWSDGCWIENIDGLYRSGEYMEYLGMEPRGLDYTIFYSYYRDPSIYSKNNWEGWLQPAWFFPHLGDGGVIDVSGKRRVYPALAVEGAADTGTARAAEVRNIENAKALEYPSLLTGASYRSAAMDELQATSRTIRYLVVCASANSMATASIESSDQVYTGSALQPAASITLNGKTLRRDVDYSLSYNDNTEVGIATVTAYGMGAYVGAVSTTFQIKPAPISTAALEKASYTYTGKIQKPLVTSVAAGSLTLDGSDYAVLYSNANSKNAGTYTVTVSGKGNFTGNKVLTYKIKQASNKATAKNQSVKKTFTVKALAKKARAFALPKVTTKFGKASWKVTAKDKKNALTLSGKKVKVKKGAKKGTYTIKLQATVKKTANYKAAKTKTVKVKVIVK